jgi:hypothetical protein
VSQHIPGPYIVNVSEHPFSLRSEAGRDIVAEPPWQNWREDSMRATVERFAALDRLVIVLGNYLNGEVEDVDALRRAYDEVAS